MQTIREIVHPKKSTIRIRIPESFINKDIEVIACPVEKESSDAYIFTDLAGRLKWTGDAVKEQRRLRDEW